MLYPNRRIEIWQVRMFVKQCRTHGWSSYFPGKNIFIPQQKSSNLYIIYILCHWQSFWLCIYAHCSNMRSQMLSTRGSFEICQEQMFVKQRRKHSWSSYLLVALTELRKMLLHIFNHEKTRKILFSHEKSTKNLVCTKETRQNFTCKWLEHLAIVSSWTLKCNASAVVVVAEKMWISQNVLWLPCSNCMSRL